MIHPEAPIRLQVGEVGVRMRHGRLKDYNVEWMSGYAQRRARFLRGPDVHVAKTRIYVGETLIYEEERARYARGA